jgi:hypothetical protein
MTTASEPASSQPLRDAFRFYRAHQEEIVDKYDGRVVVIKDGEILGAYDDELAAISETEKVHVLGTFLVQRVSPGPEGYTQTFHSRVAFP